MTKFERMKHKGSSKKNERLKLICEIRHQHTNYDKLTVFYALYPQYRSELNSQIGKLIDNGPEGILEFRENVKSIESWVNLNIKGSQKRFIDEQIQTLKEKNPSYSNSTLKRMAQDKLDFYLKRNNEHTIRTKGN